MKKSQHGFSLIEVIIVLVVVGVIGFAGWYILKSRSKPSQLASNSKTMVQQAENLAYKDWETYTSSKGGVSFKYPSLDTLSWSKIIETDWSTVQEVKPGKPSLDIEAQKTHEVPESSGRITILQIYKGSLAENESSFDASLLPRYTKQRVELKGVAAILYTSNYDEEITYKEYLFERANKGDVVVMYIVSKQEKLLDDAFQGIVDTLKLDI